MRRNPGVGSSPAALAHTMRRHLVGDPFLVGPYQWGVVHAIHGSYSSTLAGAASVGDQTLSLTAEPSVNDFLLVGTNTPLRVTAVSGSGPYTATLAVQVGVAEASGAAVTAMKTCDLYLDGSQTLADTTYLTPGVRWLQSYTPTAGDVVFVARGTGGLQSDRLILGIPAV